MPFTANYSLSPRSSLDCASTPPRSPESLDRPRSRSLSRPLSAGGKVQLRGPERFFYDKSSYTGVHSRGGASVIDKSSFVGNLRPEHHRGNNFGLTTGRPLDDSLVRDRARSHLHTESMTRSSRMGSRASSPAKPQKQSGDRFGPERFFYDKSTYTGCHAQGGGIDGDVAGDALMQSLRPSQNLRSTYTHVGGHPLRTEGPTSVDSMPASLSRPQKRRASVGSVREFKGPERFFYDTSSYTGVHKHGGPNTIDENAKGSWIHSMRPGMH